MFKRNDVGIFRLDIYWFCLYSYFLLRVGYFSAIFNSIIYQLASNLGYFRALAQIKFRVLVCNNYCYFFLEETVAHLVYIPLLTTPWCFF